MIIIGMISYNHLREIILHSAFDSAQNVLKKTETKAHALYETAENNINLFTDSGILRNYLLSDKEKVRSSSVQTTLIHLFSSYLKANPGYSEIRLIMPDGTESVRVVPLELPDNDARQGEALFFRAMRDAGSDIFTTIYKNPVNKELALIIAKKIRPRVPARQPVSLPPAPAGYLAVTINIDFLAESIKLPHEVYGSTFLISDLDGNILFSSDPLEKRPYLSSAMLKHASQITPTDTPARISEEGASFLLFSQIINNDLIILAITPEDELFADSRELALTIGLITLLAGIIFSGLLIFLGEKIIVSPIMTLRNAVINMSRGKLELKLGNTPNDEIGDLARSFMDMNKHLLESEERANHLAYHDFLTGLPNRVMFNDFLKRSMAGVKRNKELLGVLLIDIDNFKRFNDTIGRNQADFLLKKIATQLESTIRASDLTARLTPKREPDMIARIGGDEFIIVLPSVDRHNDAAVVARRLLKTLEKPFIINEHEIYVTASIGISIYPLDTEQADELIKRADAAMFHAKESGKNNYRYFSPSMNVAALERLTLEGELRRALENDEFSLQYQPQVDCLSGEIVGLEALIRWHHPHRGLVYPGEFISIAEECGLIIQIGEWVLRSTAQQISSWRKQGVPMVPVSINLSSIQFLNSRIATMIDDTLRDTDIPPSSIKIELTESILMKAEDKALQRLEAIQKTGVHICLDDFGTGYSSLTYLKEFPINVLKIDRSFITNITEKRDAEIISAIIALAKCLNLVVVAEGVENWQQHDFLIGKKCDIIQGFFFHKPMSVRDVEKILLSGEPEQNKNS